MKERGGSVLRRREERGFSGNMVTNVISLFHKKRYAFTRKVLKKTSFFFFGTTVRMKH